MENAQTIDSLKIILYPGCHLLHLFVHQILAILTAFQFEIYEQKVFQNKTKPLLHFKP